MIQRVNMRGFRGRNLDVPLTKFTLIQGAVGTGKTAILDAVRYGAALPCPRLGETNLHQLSPTGQWSIELTIGDHNFGRSVRDSRGGFAYDGRAVGAKEFDDRVRRVLCLDEQHLDARAFVGLSGEKRAALFSSILIDKQVAIGDCFKVAGAPGGADTLDALARTLLGEDDAKRLGPLFAGLKPGDSQSLVADLARAKAEAKLAQNDAGRRMADAEAAKGTEAADLPELRRQIEALDQQIGKHRADVVNLQSARSSYEGMQNLVAVSERQLESLKSRLALAKGSASAIPELERQLAEAQAKEASAGADLNLDTLGKAIAAVENMAPPRDLAGDDMKIGWNRGVAAASGALDAMVSDEKRRRAMPSAAAVKAEISNCQGRLERERRAAATVEDLAGAIRAQDEALVRARAQLQATAPPGDAAAIERLLADDIASRQGLASKASAAERRGATIAAGAAAAADLAKFQAAIRVIDEAVALVQKYRDITLGAAVQRITEPMERILALVFGRPVPVNFSMVGQGRGAQVDLKFRLDGERDVRLVDLSDGEFVLVSVAFLATLQSIKGTPGSLLMLEIDALTHDHAERLMEALPQLGIEQVLLATNRDVAMPAGEGWSRLMISQSSRAEWSEEAKPVAPPGLFAPAS